jgi:MoaA/NifB/PqqE/SkfB family radical SAM enzyme
MLNIWLPFFSFRNLELINMPLEAGRALKIIANWSLNRAQRRKLPLAAVFSMTHYCNFYCPMCPFGDPDKAKQLKFATAHNMNTEQWKTAMTKAAKYCIWSFMEGGEPTSRQDFIELVQHLKNIHLPVTVVTNGSLLHNFDVDVLRHDVDKFCLSIDSIHKDSFCKIRGVTAEVYDRVMRNLQMLDEHNVNRYTNAVITKWNAEEFITGEYFDRIHKEFGIGLVTPTLVEDRVGVAYETLSPDAKTIRQIAQGILKYMNTHDAPRIGVPSLYWRQIVDFGRPVFKECGVWKGLTVLADGSVRVPCWKLAVPTQSYNILEHDIEEIWNMPEWENLKGCHECEHLTCIWLSSQNIITGLDCIRNIS